MTSHLTRRATEDDFDGVMGIGDVYFGLDYLRHVYFTIMDDPNARCYVYVIGEEIVGFTSIILLDDGITFFVRASRIKSGFRGKGLYGKLLHYACEDHKNIESIKYEAMVTHGVTYESKKLHLQSTHTQLVQKSVLNYHLKMERLKVPQQPLDTILETFSSAEITSLFDDKNTCEGLFPGGRVIIDWVPVRLLASNMRYILTSGVKPLASRNNTSRVSLLTIGTPVPCQLGLRYCLDVFGTDCTLLREHVLSHIEYIKTVTDKNTVIVLMVVVNPLLANVLDKLLSNMDIPTYDFNPKSITVFEDSFK
ncbi:probable N-acetyltransferase 16 [Haliotis rubra]|uniref:probable N-acetyltransferase 16 n=1 Tax=Haliotis rubra TaxID=36100 RepID=UPI001EE52381|nr:probable N-acetyltransferase 16 [Haliotis rubra]